MKQKIDFSKIQGFDTIDENIRKQLTNLEIDIPEPDYTGYVKKDLLDRKLSELAEKTKQLRAKNTEQENLEEENKKKFADMEAELNALKKEKNISVYKSKFIAQGYDEKLAFDTASALEAGEFDKVFDNQKSFLDSQKKQWEKQNMQTQPNLSNGSTVTAKDAQAAEYAQLRKDFGLSD